MQPSFDRIVSAMALRCATLACKGCAAELPFVRGAGGRIVYHVCRTELMDCAAEGIYREFGLRMEWSERGESNSRELVPKTSA